MMRARFHPDATAEMIAAARFYNQAATGLGAMFLKEIESAIELLIRNPEASPKITSAIHKFILRRFPFNIFYSVESDALVVMAVAHQHRRPGYWKNRKSEG